MKVLMIDNSPRMGGSVHSAALLLSGLAASGVEVTLVASRPDLFAPRLDERVRVTMIEWDGFADVFAPSHGLYGGLPVVGQPLALRRFAKRLTPEIQTVLETDTPDLVHLNNLNLPQVPVAEATTAADIPYAVHCRMIRSFSRREAKLAAQAGRVLCVSRAVRDELQQQMSLSPRQLAVVPNGIDPEPFAGDKDEAARAELGVPLDVPVAVMLGRLAQWKGHHVAIAAWRMVRRQLPEAVLAIVGAGETEYLEQCKALAGRLDLAEAVRFIGHRDNVPRVLQAADLVVHASCYDDPSRGTIEAFGRVVIEAMAAGLPVVATAAGGVPEIVVDGVTGKLVRPGDPDALAEAMQFYLEDPDAAFEAGLEGRRRVKQEFLVEHMVRATITQYEQILAESR